MSEIVLGSRVSFSWPDPASKDGFNRGTGEVISNPDDKGRVQVAVTPTPPEARHFVILCTLTWLTAIDG